MSLLTAAPTAIPLPFAGVATLMGVILAAVFAFAAASKATDQTATARELGDLGVPAPLAVARTLPPIEAGIAVALIATPAVGAAAALAVLAAFTGVLVATVRSGRQVSCGCLGALSRQLVSWATVARNAALIAMALIASTSRTLVAPELAAIVATTLALLIAAVAVQLVALRDMTGRLWSVALAGEAADESSAGTQPEEENHD